MDRALLTRRETALHIYCQLDFSDGLFLVLSTTVKQFVRTFISRSTRPFARLTSLTIKFISRGQLSRSLKLFTSNFSKKK